MSKRSPYIITDYTKRKAKKLNVTVTRSKNATKKIDIYNKSGKKVGTAGARGYMDYPTYINELGKKFADKRRSLYRTRHKGENKKVGSNGYWAWNLLW
jgi:hypothetical protein